MLVSVAGVPRRRLAQGLFLDAAGAFAPLQFGHHVGRAESIVGQRDHGVEPQVGHFIDDLGPVATVVGVLGGHDHLGGLLADLFQEGVGPLVQQARDVAFLRVAAVAGLAAFDDGSQTRQ